jgi:hypothetical protein
MGNLAEKTLTISLTFHVQITDDVLQTKPSYLPAESDDSWKEAMEDRISRRYSWTRSHLP